MITDARLEGKDRRSRWREGTQSHYLASRARPSQAEPGRGLRVAHFEDSAEDLVDKVCGCHDRMTMFN